MSKNVQGARVLIKRSDVSGDLPTIPLNEDHTTGWASTDIYTGEFFINIADDRAWIRTNSPEAVELALATYDAGGGQYKIDPSLISFPINNPADNRILTATDGNFDIDAEQNLTFDGSTLNVKGNVNVEDADGNNWFVTDSSNKNIKLGDIDATTNGTYLEVSDNEAFTFNNGSVYVPTGDIYIPNITELGTSNVVFVDTTTGKLTYNTLLIDGDDNNVITATGTGQFQGEGNLTFDGDILTIQNKISLTTDMSTRISTVFSDSTTQHNKIGFVPENGSTQNGSILYETSNYSSDTSKSVLHLISGISNSNTTNYISIHGSSGEETIKLFTGGKIENEGDIITQGKIDSEGDITTQGDLISAMDATIGGVINSNGVISTDDITTTTDISSDGDITVGTGLYVPNMTEGTTNNVVYYDTNGKLIKGSMPYIPDEILTTYSNQTSGNIIVSSGEKSINGLSSLRYEGETGLILSNGSLYLTDLDSSTNTNMLYYNTSTGKVTYGATPIIDLGSTTTTTSVTITNTAGDDATINAASTSKAGVMTSTMVTEHNTNNAKVSDINHNVSTDLSTTTSTTSVTINSSDGTNATINAANATAAGIITSEAQDIGGVKTFNDEILIPTSAKFNNTALYSPDVDTDLLNIRRYAEDYTVLNLWSPPQTSWGGARESTLSLVRGDGNEYFIDLYNMDYGSSDAGNYMDYGDPQMGIRFQKRATGVYTPFNFEYGNGTTEFKAMVIRPNDTDTVNRTSVEINRLIANYDGDVKLETNINGIGVTGVVVATGDISGANLSGTNTGDNAINSLYSGLISNVNTDLTSTHNTTNVVINSSDGTDATINAASGSAAGIMTKAMFDEHVINNAKISNIDPDYQTIIVSNYTELNNGVSELELKGAGQILFSDHISVPGGTIFQHDFTGIAINLSGFRLSLNNNSYIHHVSSKVRTRFEIYNGTIRATKTSSSKTFFDSTTTAGSTKISFNNISFDDIVTTSNVNNSEGHIKITAGSTHPTRIEFYDMVVFTDNENITNLPLLIQLGDTQGCHVFASQNKFTGTVDRTKKMGIIGVQPTNSIDTDFVYDGSWDKVEHTQDNITIPLYNIYSDIVSSGGNTDLSSTHNTTNVVIGSSNGNSATIAAASTSAAGVVTTATQTFSGAKTFTSTVTATNFIGSSDRSLKKDISPIEVDVSSVPLVQFHWKEGETNMNYGVIAQDLQEVCPDMVHTKVDGNLGVNYINFIIARMHALEEKIKKMEDK